MGVELKVITGDRIELKELQRVLEGAPTYSLRVSGRPPSKYDASKNFTILPEGKGYEDKFTIGVYFGGEMIGCVDLIRGYPSRSTAHVGLLLLREEYQGRGLGQEVYQKIEEYVRTWPGIETVRLGVVATNDVRDFWRKQGFTETGEVKPYDKMQTQVFVMEKPLQ